MDNNKALSTEQVADILHVSKSTIYDLIKKGEITSYKVGRKVRFTQEDVDNYIAKSRSLQIALSNKAFLQNDLVFELNQCCKNFIICGQDVILDVLSNYLRLNGVSALRAYIGSYDSLISLYQGKVQVTAAHLWDGDTDQYNIPYVRRLLPGIPAVIIHLTGRMQGFYVAKGNPKNIKTWNDFAREDITMINREKGAGSRVLLDENLRLLGISGRQINGYANETSSHLTVASAVSSGEVDVAIGSEKIAKQVDNIDFIPIKKERYQLIVKKDDLNTHEVMTMLKIVRSATFKKEFGNIGGYDTTDIGKIVAET
ncbi:helix-turn-helix transcriptional regulator [Sporomusa acidovorans]|uniref:PBP superfamily domain protein n=2 Tax=Sporomusa TaxID=2375 RepID=A0ABZ3IX55_SPOA4|nr:helix-turn-helix transcriptional regulator [Sporomusa acidovorans]OZC23351.1 PBP superfamily domain protein [Sporomusa acidovorans DSM 3132]SDE42757.1 putative molybdopterin biosynthesis protein [Sporomusa acidovorans]